MVHERACGIAQAAFMHDVRCVKGEAEHTTYMSTCFARSGWSTHGQIYAGSKDNFHLLALVQGSQSP